jgi:hypothetical protein
MPFEKYLRDDDGDNVAATQYPDYTYGDNARTSALGIDSSTFSSSVQFQIPQFMLDGPPTLALGGGAEVLPTGMFNSPGTMASSWFSNSGFSTKSLEDA